MAAQYRTVCGDEIALLRGFSGSPLNEPRIVLIRDEADLLAVRLMGYPEAQLLRHFPNFILGIGSHRHQCPGKLLLRQVIQGVGLILRRRYRIADGVAAVRQLLHPGVMTGGDIVRADVQAAL